MKGFLRAGHLPTLVAALLYFDVSFMTWVLLGPLAPFLREELGLTATQQGLVTAIPLTTMVVVAGSLLRPIGGWLSDRFGGYRLLVTLLAGVAVCLGAVSAGPELRPAVVLLFIGMGMLGMGNGAVFQLVPQRFPERIGLVTGVVGAAGGLGGFFLPSVLGAVRDGAGTYGPGLALFAATFVVGTLALLEFGDRWSKRWTPDAIRHTGVYSFRSALRGVLAEEP